MLADTALLHIVVPAPLSFMLGMFAGIFLLLFINWMHHLNEVADARDRENSEN